MKQLNYDTIYCKSINCSHPAGFVEIPNQLFRRRLLLHERKQIAGILFWDSQQIKRYKENDIKYLCNG